MINLTFEVLGQASFVLKEMFIFLSALAYVKRWAVSTEREKCRLIEATGDFSPLYNVMQKASCFPVLLPWPTTTQGSHHLVPSHLPGKEQGRQSWPALPAATSSGRHEEPTNCLRGQDLSIRLIHTLLRPPGRKKKEAILKNKQLTSYCSTPLLRRPLCLRKTIFWKN